MEDGGPPGETPSPVQATHPSPHQIYLGGCFGPYGVLH
jgi:hypothetical protein